MHIFAKKKHCKRNKPKNYESQVSVTPFAASGQDHSGGLLSDSSPPLPATTPT
jgi:hypothetical protein